MLELLTSSFIFSALLPSSFPSSSGYGLKPLINETESGSRFATMHFNFLPNKNDKNLPSDAKHGEQASQIVYITVFKSARFLILINCCPSQYFSV